MKRGKQSGFTLIELVVALGVISILSAIYFQTKQNDAFEREAQVAADGINELITMVQAFEHDSLNTVNTKERFPSAMSDLVSKGYADACTSNSFTVLGTCRPVDYTFWGDSITITSYDENLSASPAVRTHAQIKYPLTKITDAARRKRAAAYIVRTIPFVTVDAAKTYLTIRVNRSGASVRSDVFLRKDGDTPLTGDWNVGNYSIANAKNVLVRTQDGRQMNLGATVISSFAVAVTSGAGTKVSMPSCPTGLTPAISTAVKTVAGDEFTTLGGVSSYYTTYAASKYWQVFIKYRALDKATNKWKDFYKGEVNVNISCII